MQRSCQAKLIPFFSSGCPLVLLPKKDRAGGDLVVAYLCPVTKLEKRPKEAHERRSSSELGGGGEVEQLFVTTVH